ncbi:MAG: hypothetical protein N3F09_10040 [Bacteroidia bacterium]|nr:hypothetical protein [Bacteroidia bacterium]
MKKVAFILLLILGGLNFINAQESNRNAGQNPQAIVANKARNEALKAQEKLGLSREQFAKWYQSAFKRISAIQPLREELKNTNDNTKVKGIREQIKENRIKFDQEVNTFLTDDQKSKWAAWKEERKNQQRQFSKDKKAKLVESEEEVLDFEE